MWCRYIRAGKEIYAHKRTYTYSHIYEGGGGGGGGRGDEREHIHIYQVIHHQYARDTLSRCILYMQTVDFQNLIVLEYFIQS